MKASGKVILVLQIGSLGDTVIALPCYREIARRHPDAEIYLVTNFPTGSKMVPAEAILAPTGVIKGALEYPMPLRSVAKAWQLRRCIMAHRPSVLYYLLPETRSLNLVRHFAFFKSCGIPSIIGMPWSRKLRFVRETAPGALWESEASRLLRTISAAGPPSDADRDLALTADEHTAAAAVLQGLLAAERFIAVSVGGKVPINDWGNSNWSAMLAALSQSEPRLGAVFIGSADERPRNDRLSSTWTGPSLNTCGQMTPRETAALLSLACAFVGHDTGTLHLAAAVSTPIVAVFSARNLPGKWFSDRASDTFFYNHVACAGCELVRIEDCPHQRKCMASHDPASVAAAVRRALPAFEGLG